MTSSGAAGTALEVERMEQGSHSPAQSQETCRTPLGTAHWQTPLNPSHCNLALQIISDLEEQEAQTTWQRGLRAAV